MRSREQALALFPEEDKRNRVEVELLQSHVSAQAWVMVGIVLFSSNDSN